MSFMLRTVPLFHFSSFSLCFQVVMPVGGKIVDTFIDNSTAYITILGDCNAELEIIHFHVATENAELFSDSYEYSGMFQIENSEGKMRLHLFKIPEGDWGIYSQEFQNKYGENGPQGNLDTENIRRLLSGFDG